MYRRRGWRWRRRRSWRRRWWRRTAACACVRACRLPLVVIKQKKPARPDIPQRLLYMQQSTHHAAAESSNSHDAAAPFWQCVLSGTHRLGHVGRCGRVTVSKSVERVTAQPHPRSGQCSARVTMSRVAAFFRACTRRVWSKLERGQVVETRAGPAPYKKECVRIHAWHKIQRARRKVDRQWSLMKDKREE